MVKLNEYSREWDLISPEIQRIISSFQLEAPVKIGAVAKSLGLVVKKSTLSASVSGEIRNIDGTFVIKVNRHDTSERQRFTIAHEIGHFLLHRDLIGDGIVDDVLYRSNLSNAMETQANRIAADILMPGNLVRSCISNYAGEKKEYALEKAAQELEVSVVALKIRVGD
ncbi:ImmA/IrrE family metallo-endopeptidase [Oceanobacter kriegii]|uniref:ImmA/IrrE family metallo-endopeptidase n=1 Tax=Oceanobacter kriegii TaxID=64972 RepID=UPI000569C537|nr:ImmA/IrrE family metallo-endopeptidase [Oceanobacter kriegii]